MEKTFDQDEKKIETLSRTLKIHFTVLFILSCVAAADIASLLWTKEWATYGFIGYIGLSVGTILVGYKIKKIPFEKIRNTYYSYHISSIVMLNSIIGITVTTMAILTDIKRMTLMLILMISFYALAIIASAGKFIVDNLSFLAHMRLELWRVLNVLMMSEIIWPQSSRLALIPCLLFLSLISDATYKDYKKGLFPLR